MSALRLGRLPDGTRDIRILEPATGRLTFARYGLRIPKYTSRISDLRAAGYVIDCRRGKDGIDRYVVIERAPVTAGEQVGMAL